MTTINVALALVLMPASLCLGFTAATISFTAWNIIVPLLLNGFGLSLASTCTAAHTQARARTATPAAPCTHSLDRGMAALRRPARAPVFISVMLDVFNCGVLTVAYGYHGKVDWRLGAIYGLISATFAALISNVLVNFLADHQVRPPARRSRVTCAAFPSASGSSTASPARWCLILHRACSRASCTSCRLACPWGSSPRASSCVGAGVCSKRLRRYDAVVGKTLVPAAKAKPASHAGRGGPCPGATLCASDRRRVPAPTPPMGTLRTRSGWKSPVEATWTTQTRKRASPWCRRRHWRPAAAGVR